MGKLGVWENAEPGVKRKLLNMGEFLMMMEVHFEAGAKGNAHRHIHEQMTYCIEGKMAFTVEGKEIVIEKGETLVIPGDAIHSAIALEKSVILDVFHPIRKDLLGEE